MEDDEDSAIMRRKTGRAGPPRAVIVGIPVFGSIVAVLLVVVVLWLWATARAFVVPQSAMAPAIFGGSEIHADATEYGMRLPVLGNVGSRAYPDRGDVIVFDWPKDESYVYVMRVIAVGGDEVQVGSDGSVDVRGQALRHCPMGRWPKGRDPNGVADGRKAFVEWNHGHAYVILLGSEKLKAEETAHCVAKPCTVPTGQIFVLGDNRSASADSRAWGFVPLDHVIGKVTDAQHPDDLAAYQRCMKQKESE